MHTTVNIAAKSYIFANNSSFIANTTNTAHNTTNSNTDHPVDTMHTSDTTSTTYNTYTDTNNATSTTNNTTAPLVFPPIDPFPYPVGCTPYTVKFQPKLKPTLPNTATTNNTNTTNTTTNNSNTNSNTTPTTTSHYTDKSTLLDRAMLTAGKVKAVEDKGVQLQKAVAFYFDTHYTNYEMSLALLADTFRVSYYGKLKPYLKR